MSKIVLELEEDFLRQAYKEACSEWKTKLAREIPDFEFVETYAIKRGILKGSDHVGLRNFCTDAGLNPYAMQVRWVSDSKDPLHARGIYLDSMYDWKLMPCSVGSALVLVPFNKNIIIT